MKKIFSSADILLPKGTDMELWSTVACDQFSSQTEYWEALDKLIGEAPSTLRLMLPEAYLEVRDQFAEAEKINSRMEEYIQKGLFETIMDSYIYVERALASGKVPGDSWACWIWRSMIILLTPFPPSEPPRALWWTACPPEFGYAAALPLKCLISWYSLMMPLTLSSGD